MMTSKPAPLNTFGKKKEQKEDPRPVLLEPESLQEPVQQKVFRLTKSQARALKKFCADSDMTMQDVVLEGINMVLKSRGLPTI
jgi:hypothetical protein